MYTFALRHAHLEPVYCLPPSDRTPALCCLASWSQRSPAEPAKDDVFAVAAIAAHVFAERPVLHRHNIGATLRRGCIDAGALPSAVNEFLDALSCSDPNVRPSAAGALFSVSAWRCVLKRVGRCAAARLFSRVLCGSARVTGAAADGRNIRRAAAALDGKPSAFAGPAR
jgi:hypothetical protein